MRRIIEIQRNIREAGRIRTGEQVATSRGGRRPAKLDKFRITSRNRAAVESCAAVYGGTVAEWKNAPGGTQWEVYTDRDSIDVLLPPDGWDLSVVYELWNTGGCVRRCSGSADDSEGNVIEGVSDAACVCDPDNRECKLTTRLTVFLPEVPGLGTWRLESHGYYAATELTGTIELLRLLVPDAKLIPARLWLDPRQVKRITKGNAETYNFVVPTIDVRDETLGNMLAGARLQIAPALTIMDALDGPSESEAIAALESGGLTPVPVEPGPSVAESVVVEPKPKTPRKNAAEPIKPTGKRPRTRTVPNEPDEGPQDEPKADPGPPVAPDPADAAEGADPGTLDERRAALRERFGALPTPVANRVKADWPTLHLPSLRAAKGWDEQAIALAERLADAAETEVKEQVVKARQRCAIMTRELEWSDEERHEWVVGFTGKPGLTALTLDELGTVESELLRLTGGDNAQRGDMAG